ncbi:MAG: hypothetical protein ACOYU7_01560 [Bacillota bacterium]
MSPSKLIDELTKAGITFSLRKQAGELKVVCTPKDPGQEPARVKALLDELDRRWDEAKAYLLHAEPIGEATSLHGERLRVYQARPLCVLSRTCWRLTIGCKLSPDTSEYGWLKRCRERVSGRAMHRQDAARERAQ